MIFLECSFCDNDVGYMQNTEDGTLCGRCQGVYEAGIHIGEQRATAKIVAWLRSVAKQYDDGDMVPQDDYSADTYRVAAIAIELGDHIEHTAAQGGDGEK